MVRRTISPLGTMHYLVALVFGLFELLLGLRLLFKLFAANPDAGFVRWLYQTTAPLVAPFTGIFASPSTDEGLVLEASTLVALIVYALIYFLIIELLELLARTSDTRSSRVVSRRETVEEVE